MRAPAPRTPPPPPMRSTTGCCVVPEPLGPTPIVLFDLEVLRFRAFVVGSFFWARAEPDNIGGSTAEASRITPVVRAVRMYRYIISSHGAGLIGTGAR